MNKDKTSKKKMILPIFLGLIMIFSILGYSLTSGTDSSNTGLDSYTYNGREYIRTAQGYAVNIGEGYIQFNYGPKELEDINLPLFNIANKVYLGYDSDIKDQNIDFIIQKLNNALLYKNIRPVKACIKDSSTCPNIPIVDCSLNDKSIIISKQDKLEINTDRNCLYVKGTIADLDKVSDKLVMSWLGLI